MTKNINTICFVAGKSGGHIIPCLTLAQQYQQEHKNLSVLFFSTTMLLDATIVSTAHVPQLCRIPLRLHSVQTRSFFGYIPLFFAALHSFIVSLFYLAQKKPSCIITTGGIVSVPVCLAGFILRVPIKTYCLDAVPGKAIRLMAPFTSSLLIAFRDTQKFFPKKKCIPTPYPIKYSLDPNSHSQTKNLSDFNLDPNKKTILILGGSQGSLFLNQCMKQLITSSFFSTKTMQIIHQTGSFDTTDWHGVYTKHAVTAHVFSYTSDLASFYTYADIIICRAGAGTLFEVEFFKKKCIIIPLVAHTTTHQVDNAHAMVSQYPELFYCIDQHTIEKNMHSLFTLMHKLLST